MMCQPRRCVETVGTTARLAGILNMGIIVVIMTGQHISSNEPKENQSNLARIPNSNWQLK